MAKVIDYKKILNNIDISINAMEYDCERSAGKAKFNAATLNSLYEMRANLEKKVPKDVPPKTITTPTEKKEK